MEPAELIADLRNRINPAYVGYAGTEAYERKVCADLLEAQQARIGELAEQNETLRSALAGLIGADSGEELRQMEVAMRLLPAPDADKAVSINAIHALLTPNLSAENLRKRDVKLLRSVIDRMPFGALDGCSVVRKMIDELEATK